MPKFIVCPSCGGRGTSSAYLGAFTSDDIDQMDGEFMEDYFAGNFDRKCDHCQGQRVVQTCKTSGCENERATIHSFWAREPHVYDHCFEHDADARESAECEALGAAERAYGA
jgi:hypothetical protein